jgi:hypothetical protein
MDPPRHLVQGILVSVVLVLLLVISIPSEKQQVLNALSISQSKYCTNLFNKIPVILLTSLPDKTHKIYLLEKNATETRKYIEWRDKCTDLPFTKPLPQLLESPSSSLVSQQEQQKNTNNNLINMTTLRIKPPSSSSNIQHTMPQQRRELQQSQPLSPIVPYLRFPQQLLLPKPALQQGSTITTEGFNTRGSINSLIYTIHTIWIATGNWSMSVNNGSPTSFNTNMTWFNNNGTSDHTHEFLNFKPTGGGKVIKVQQPVNSVFIKGVMDVGTNHRISWKNVPTTISINGGKTITIVLDDKATNHHFAGQPIFGVVTSFVRCSDTPGPNMEVLPPCG